MKNIINKNSKELIPVICGLVIPLLLWLGLSMRQLRDDKGDLYTPGTSIKKSERVAIEALQDSTLNARVATYNELLREYKDAWECAVPPNAHTMYMDRPVHPWCRRKIAAANINCGLPRTLREYKNALDTYAQDSIEGRYKYLRDVLNAQKSIQKQK